MKILALETATLAGSAALVEGGRILAESNLAPGRTHSSTLLPEIQKVLQEAGMSATDLDIVAVGLGPGSFTGLRIGLAIAKGLAWAAGKPLVGVPTLDAMARAVQPGDGGIICPVIDARKGQVYAAMYRPSGPLWERLTDYEALTPDGLAGIISEPVVFFGEGVRTWGGVISESLGPLFIRGDEAFDFPRAVNVAAEAEMLYDRGMAADPADVAPLYVRPPDIKPPAEPHNRRREMSL